MVNIFSDSSSELKKKTKQQTNKKTNHKWNQTKTNKGNTEIFKKINIAPFFLVLPLYFVTWCKKGREHIDISQTDFNSLPSADMLTFGKLSSKNELQHLFPIVWGGKLFEICLLPLPSSENLP